MLSSSRPRRVSEFYFNLPIYTLRFCGDLEHTDASNIKPLLKHLRVKNNGSYRMFRSCRTKYDAAKRCALAQ